MSESDRVLTDAALEMARADRLLEVAIAAQRLSVSPEYVRRLIRQRKLRGIRLSSNGPKGPWRIFERDLDAYISQLSCDGMR